MKDAFGRQKYNVINYTRNAQIRCTQIVYCTTTLWEQCKQLKAQFSTTRSVLEKYRSVKNQPFFAFKQYIFTILSRIHLFTSPPPLHHS